MDLQTRPRRQLAALSYSADLTLWHHNNIQHPLPALPRLCRVTIDGNHGCEGAMSGFCGGGRHHLSTLVQLTVES
jgi:hypothetical protein